MGMEMMMGLDITAYSGLKPAPDAKMEDGQPVEWKRHFMPSINISFDRADGLTEQPYTFAWKMDFRAGSYGGYGEWRRELAIFAGLGSPEDVWKTPQPSGPFVELVNFSDCEGTLGPVASAKLAKDFDDFAIRALTHAAAMAAGGIWWIELYLKWRAAFTMAARDGAVDFH